MSAQLPKDARLRPPAAAPETGFTAYDGADSYGDRLWPALIDVLKAENARRVAPRVFDLGCGSGAMLARLRAHGFVAMGVETSPAALKRAPMQHPGVKIVYGSAYDDLAARHGRWPIVISLEVVEHLVDVHAFAATLFELVEPGGIAIVSTPFHGYIKNLAISLAAGWDAHWQTLETPGWHIKFFSPATLTALLESAGFTVERILRFGRRPLTLATGMMAVARKPR
jgi:2-polyprenyl-3-methyl-5-hydroxy-6-metoxy-1,4-benzoquinol methylase